MTALVCDNDGLVDGSILGDLDGVLEREGLLVSVYGGFEVGERDAVGSRVGEFAHRIEQVFELH